VLCIIVSIRRRAKRRRERESEREIRFPFLNSHALTSNLAVQIVPKIILTRRKIWRFCGSRVGVLCVIILSMKSSDALNTHEFRYVFVINIFVLRTRVVPATNCVIVLLACVRQNVERYEEKLKEIPTAVGIFLYYFYVDRVRISYFAVCISSSARIASVIIFISL